MSALEKRALAALIPAADRPKVADAIWRAIEASLDKDATVVTRAELKRRFEICTKLIEHLKGDLKWSLQRTLDYLPIYLRCEVHGIAYTPDTRRMWAVPQHEKEEPRK